MPIDFGHLGKGFERALTPRGEVGHRINEEDGSAPQAAEPTSLAAERFRPNRDAHLLRGRQNFLELYGLVHAGSLRLQVSVEG
ncbi:MAG: hypothetical protein JSV19_05070 [Phycisphaerales bacterium]|nr:MAG: hypothetical protein JSV19_05070 [Phycisphaerales bacterium]